MKFISLLAFKFNIYYLRVDYNVTPQKLMWKVNMAQEKFTFKLEYSVHFPFHFKLFWSIHALIRVSKEFVTVQDNAGSVKNIILHQFCCYIIQMYPSYCKSFCCCSWFDHVSVSDFVNRRRDIVIWKIPLIIFMYSPPH